MICQDFLSAVMCRVVRVYCQQKTNRPNCYTNHFGLWSKRYLEFFNISVLLSDTCSRIPLHLLYVTVVLHLKFKLLCWNNFFKDVMFLLTPVCLLLEEQFPLLWFFFSPNFLHICFSYFLMFLRCFSSLL